MDYSKVIGTCDSNVSLSLDNRRYALCLSFSRFEIVVGEEVLRCTPTALD